VVNYKHMSRKNILLASFLTALVTILGATAYVILNFNENNSETASAAGVLGLNQVYVKNNNSFPLQNDLVTIPLSFRESEYFPNGLSNIKIGSLDTQVTPTSFYKNNSVKTAVARVIISMPANTELIFDITSGSNPGSFTPLPEVSAFLNGGLKAFSKDLGGGTYQTIFTPGDGRLVEDGPVVKTYEFIKKHRPIPGCSTTLNQTCLPYLFTSHFWVTVVKGKPYVQIKHFIVNFGNLAEDTWTNGNPYNYTEGQNGFVFFDQVYFDTNTSGTPSYLHILDQSYLNPSVKQVVSSSLNRYFVMPTDAQTILSQAPYYDGPPPSVVTNPSNYVSAGQGFLTYSVLHINSSNPPAFIDPFDESNVETGQSLARFNQVNGHLFDEIVRPDAIDPGFNFANNAQVEYDRVVNTISDPINGHRFGQYDYGIKDMGAGSVFNHYIEDPFNIVRYLMSCDTRCAKRYIDMTRFHMYGSAHVVAHPVGVDLAAHPQTNFSNYRNTSFEKELDGSDTSCDIQTTINTEDKLGFGNSDLNTNINFRRDANGRYCNVYSNWAWLALSHKWTTRDAAHASLALELYRWMFTGDFAARTLGEDQIKTFGSAFQYTYLYRCDFTRPGSCYPDQTRAMGRALTNFAKAFSSTGNSYYATLAGYMFKIIDNVKDHSQPGAYGVDASGDQRPVQFFSYYRPPACHLFTREESLVLDGIETSYKDAITDTTILNRMRTVLDEGLFSVLTYMVKSPSEVKNNMPNPENPNAPIMQGTGGWTRDNYICNNGDGTDFTQYFYSSEGGYSPDRSQVIPGICHAVKLSKQLGLNPWYDTRFRDAFERGFVYPSAVTRDDFGIRIQNLNIEELCGLRVALNLPTALENNNCVDNDGDGYSTCTGDCNDNNANINPGKNELCSDGIDNNCNQLFDCNERSCSGSCSGQRTYCGDLFVSNPNSYGLNEQCDVKGFGTGGTNSCTGYTCVPAGVSLTQGCLCSNGQESPRPTPTPSRTPTPTPTPTPSRTPTPTPTPSSSPNPTPTPTPSESPPPPSNGYLPPWSTVPATRTITLNYNTGISDDENGVALMNAVASLRAGDRLIVGGATGRTYRLPTGIPFTITLSGTANQPIWIDGSLTPKPVITRPNASFEVIDFGLVQSGSPTASYIALRNFEITGGRNGIRVHNTTNIWLDSLDIHNIGEGGVKSDTSNTSYLYVTRNLIHDTAGQFGDGIRIGKDTTGITRNSTYALNQIYNTRSSQQGDGIEVRGGSHSNLIAANVIHDTIYPCIRTNDAAPGMMNVISKNIVYSCDDNGIQVEGYGVRVEGNLLLGPFGNKAFDNTHGNNLRDVVVVHNTMFSVNGYGAGLWGWNGQPNMVFANNAVYVRNCRTLGYSIAQFGDKIPGVYKGNVAYSEDCNGIGSDGTKGIPSAGYKEGSGLTDFSNVTHWSGFYPPIPNYRPSDRGAIIGSADPSWLIEKDLLGDTLQAPYEAGAIDNHSGAPTPTPTSSPNITPTPSRIPTPTPSPTTSPTPTPSIYPPKGPSGLYLGNVQSDRISLFWTDNSDNEAGFLIQRKVGDGEFVNLAAVEKDSIAYNDFSVGPNKKYTYRVQAYNSAGVSNYSNEASVTTPPLDDGTPPPSPPPTPSPPPGATQTPNPTPTKSPDSSRSPTLKGPVNLRGEITGDTSVYLTWTTNFTGLGIKLEVSDDGTSFREANTLPYYYFYWNVVNATPGKTYYFRMRSYDNSGFSDYSNTIEITMPGKIVGGIIFTETLYKGVRSPQVTLLQELLRKNPKIYPEGLVTGYYGPLSEKAVKIFQEKYGIVNYGSPASTGYGLVGPQTREKLNEVFGSIP